MLPTVFEAFPNDLKEYTFLEISRGGVAGNTVVNQVVAQGIFKLRTGFVDGVQEGKQSDARLHIKPDESFADNDLIGHGIRIGGHDYEIVSQTGGDNREAGVREHYTLTLQETDWSDYAI